VLSEQDWDSLLGRAAALAERLRQAIAERLAVPSAAAPLVTWRVDGDPDEYVRRLAGLGVIVRAIPGRPWVRASLGAWNSDEDLERLLAAL
jgi:selenocysteine lyase/cysteine desulfurase